MDAVKIIEVLSHFLPILQANLAAGLLIVAGMALAVAFVAVWKSGGNGR